MKDQELSVDNIIFNWLKSIVFIADFVFSIALITIGIIKLGPDIIIAGSLNIIVLFYLACKMLSGGV